MTASWLAQMGWEVYVLDGGYDGALEVGAAASCCQNPIPRIATGGPMRAPTCRRATMQAYLDWEYGLVEQLRRDGSHGFFVI